MAVPLPADVAAPTGDDRRRLRVRGPKRDQPLTAIAPERSLSETGDYVDGRGLLLDARSSSQLVAWQPPAANCWNDRAAAVSIEGALAQLDAPSRASLLSVSSTPAQRSSRPFGSMRYADLQTSRVSRMA